MNKSDNLKVHFPDNSGLGQDQEYCIVDDGRNKQKIRIHDYHKIYEIPGLYEHLFYERLKCTSPEVITSLLAKEIEKAKQSFSDLVVLDLGAGNGMVGEALKKRGVDSVVAVDIIPQAAEAAQRDRPHVYEDYFIEDISRPPHNVRKKLKGKDFKAMVCVAALGFGDIPPAAFTESFNLVANGGWIAFNIKESFINGHDTSGFSKLVRQIIENGALEVNSTHTYQHRLAIDGTPLHYTALIGRKRADILSK